MTAKPYSYLIGNVLPATAQCASDS